jgi:biotin carboxylase
MQSPALRIAHDIGLETIVVDGNAESPFAALADHFYHIDLKDKEDILHLARRLKAEEDGLSGVMTCGTDFSTSVAYVAENLGLPGIPYEAAFDASDKERMRRRFAAASVPSPQFIICTKETDLTAPLPFSYPVVVKPCDNMGARGCRRVDNQSEYAEAVQHALRFSRAGRVIVEEYMDGPEFSIDAIVYQGEITICGLADRHIFFPPYFIEMGHTMPAELHSASDPKRQSVALDEASAERLIAVFKAGVRSLGIINGAAKGDIKLTRTGPMIGEIAARLSGGYMSGWTFPYSSGVQVVKAAIEIAIGRKPSDLTPSKNWTSAERAFISIPGRIRRVIGLTDAAKIRYVRNVFPMRGRGDEARFPENNVSKCGNVISAAPTRAEAIRAAEEGVRSILIDLEVPNQDTAAFLAGAGAGKNFPPDAYRDVKDTDYVGRTLDETLQAIYTLTGKRIDWAHASVGLQKAILRGGYQGGAYYIKATN